MDKVIIYGLGQSYENQKFFLNNAFEILAYSDKNVQKCCKGFILPNEINKYNYDYIYITSEKYADEIKEELRLKYHVPAEKILTQDDMWWKVHNQGIRDEWIIAQLKNIPEHYSILDAGAGNMPYKKYCKHLNYISQDFGEYDNSNSKVGLQCHDEWFSKRVDIISDICNIPIEDQSVDAILCSEVFEHIKNPFLALKEFNRVIKTGGILLLTAPFCSLTHMAPYYYFNGFSKYWYIESLRDTGFEILEMQPYGNWFTYIAQELERLPYMMKRYGKEINDDLEKSIIICIKNLLTQSLVDSGSDEMLCFGYMVKAKKMENMDG